MKQQQRIKRDQRIYALYTTEKVSQRELARMFKMTQTHINRILQAKRQAGEQIDHN
jgi:DNA-binding transcriptional regulator LsrR (DeoR family)